jgi:hypothetical protein
MAPTSTVAAASVAAASVAAAAVASATAAPMPSASNKLGHVRSQVCLIHPLL